MERLDAQALTLIGSCRSGDWVEIDDAGSTLAKMGDKVVPLLMETLETSESWYELGGVAMAVFELKLLEAGPLLLRAFNADYPEVDEEDRDWARVNISAALSALGYRPAIPSILRALAEALESDGYVARCLINALGDLKAQSAIDAIVGAADHPDIDVWKSCRDALASIGEPAVEAILRGDPKSPGRRYLLRALEKIEQSRR